MLSFVEGKLMLYLQNSVECPLPHGRGSVSAFAPPRCATVSDRSDSMPRPRTKPPEERRDELMKAARRLFLEQGVGATTIEQITSRADVAKGTFYLYFSSKEQVLAALGGRYGGEPLVKIKAAIADTPEGIGRESWRHG